VHVEGVKDLKISGDREFVVDRKNHTPGRPVFAVLFSRTVGVST
jgi:hypothetical protein